jgi:membrane protease subunit HflC
VQAILRPVIVILFLAAIAAFTFTYTVRFTESAVVTTFGRAGEGAIQTEPGLKFKWPYPVQSVTKYDRRLRLLQTLSATQQTADDSQIVVEAFATWRVSDPLKFFQRFSNSGQRAVDHFRQAEAILRSTLSSAMGETSKYTMTELFNPVVGGSKLPELEARVLDAVTRGPEGGSTLDDYGIEVTIVGINRVVLPEETTSKVIERMGANRDRLAQELESQGTARATAIRAQANADARKIREFAQRRAAEIRARGEFEAQEYLAQQNTNAELAVFLQNLELMRDAMSKRFTLVLSASDYGLGLFSPDALSKLPAGTIPSPEGLDLTGDRTAVADAEGDR